MSYMTQNKKHKQTLESAQYGLEISFKFLNPPHTESIENIGLQLHGTISRAIPFQ